MLKNGGDFRVNSLNAIEDMKKWLLSYGELAAEIENQRERLDTLRSRLETPKAATITGLPGSGGERVDRIGAELAHIEALEIRLDADRQRARELYRQIEGAVSQIHGPGWADRRFVLRTRYLDLCSWPEISEMLFRRKGDFESKFDTYLRRTFGIHKKALEDLLEHTTNF